MEDFDCCAYIKQCSDHPYDIAPRITIREFLLIRSHVAACETCADLVDKTIERDDLRQRFDVNFN